MGLCLTKLQKDGAKKENSTSVFPPHLKTSHVIDHFVDKLPGRLQGEGIHLLRAGPGPIVQRWTHELLEDAGVHNYEDRALLLKVRDEMTAAVAEHRKRRREYLLQQQQQEEQQLRRCSGAPPGASTGGGVEGSGNPSPAAWRSIRRWSLGSLTSETGAGEATSGGGTASNFATVSISSSAMSGDANAEAAEEESMRAAAEAAAAAAATAAAANTAAWLDKNDGKPFHLQSDWLPAGVSLYRISEEMRHAASSGLDATGPERQFLIAASDAEVATIAETAGLHEGDGAATARGIREGNGDVSTAAKVAAVAADSVEATHACDGTGAAQPCSRGPWPSGHAPQSLVHDHVKSRLGRRPSDPSGSPASHSEDANVTHGSVADVLVNAWRATAGHSSGSALASVLERPFGNGCMAAEGASIAGEGHDRLHNTQSPLSEGAAVQGRRLSAPGAAEAASGSADAVTDLRCSRTMTTPMPTSSPRDAEEQRHSTASPLTPALMGHSHLDTPWTPTEPTTTPISVVPETTTAKSALFCDNTNGGCGTGSSTSSSTSSPSPSAASCSVTAVTTTGVPSSRGLSTFSSTATSIGDDAGGSSSPGSYQSAAAANSNSSQKMAGNSNTRGLAASSL